MIMMIMMMVATFIQQQSSSLEKNVCELGRKVFLAAGKNNKKQVKNDFPAWLS